MNREITLMDFFRFVLSKLKLVLILGCIVAIIAAGFTFFTAKNQYNYSGSLLVNVFDNVDEGFNSNNIYNELTISRTLMPTLVKLLQTRDFGKQVADAVNKELDKKLTSDYVLGVTRYFTNDEDFFIEFRCTSSDRAIAHSIAKNITELAPKYVSQKLSRVNLGVSVAVEKDVYTITKTDFKIIGVVAFVVTAVITVLVCLIIELLDNRIKSVEDLTEHFDYPVLGTIPDFYTHSKKEGYYGKQKAVKESEAK